MSRNIKYVLIGLICSISLTGQDLKKELALDDLNQLKRNFERYHPGLYRYTSKDSINLVFQQVSERIRDGSVMDFFTEVTWLLNKVKCGHTRASAPSEANNSFKGENLFLPLSVKYLGERLYINEPYTNEGNLKRGDEILSVNGRSIQEINELIFSHHSSDGFIKSSKYRLTERYFEYYYQLYVDRKAQLFNLRIRASEGSEREVSVTGEDWETLQSIKEPIEQGPLLRLEFKEDYALMRIRTFVSYSINNAGEDYYEFLEKSFDELNKRGTKNLILDLRGNGGGDDNYGATLVSYFADRPFRYFDRIEVTDSYSGYGNVTSRNGQNFMTSHRGLSVWQPKSNSFIGNTYVLIDGWSFSTCADVATVLHHNGWATFIGEETGGGYDGNTSGNSRTLTLSNSGIRVNLPMWKYTTSNLGHDYYGRGAKPDLPIQQTPSEFANNVDAVLNKAKELIGKN